MRAVHLTLMAVLSVLATAGCADDGPDVRTNAGPATPATTHVDIERSRFSTTELVVTPGTTVTFSNNDAFAHTVTASDRSPLSFDSGELRQGDSFAITFDRPGEYPYFCRIHPTMRATVVVTS